MDLPASLDTVQNGQAVFYLDLTSQFGQIKEIIFNENSTAAFELFKNGALFKSKSDAKEWLNRQLVELTAAEKWNGVLPTTMLPNGSVPFVKMNGEK